MSIMLTHAKMKNMLLKTMPEVTDEFVTQAIKSMLESGEVTAVSTMGHEIHKDEIDYRIIKFYVFRKASE